MVTTAREAPPHTDSREGRGRIRVPGPPCPELTPRVPGLVPLCRRGQGSDASVPLPRRLRQEVGTAPCRARGPAVASRRNQHGAAPAVLVSCDVLGGLQPVGGARGTGRSLVSADSPLCRRPEPGGGRHRGGTSGPGGPGGPEAGEAAQPPLPCGPAGQRRWVGRPCRGEGADLRAPACWFLPCAHSFVHSPCCAHSFIPRSWRHKHYLPEAWCCPRAGEGWVSVPPARWPLPPQRYRLC